MEWNYLCTTPGDDPVYYKTSDGTGTPGLTKVGYAPTNWWCHHSTDIAKSHILRIDETDDKCYKGEHEYDFDSS